MRCGNSRKYLRILRPMKLSLLTICLCGIGKKEDIPDDQYRACAFFKNREYLRKPGSLTLLYQVYVRCGKELPRATKENACDLLCFRYRMYAAALKTGGFDGRTDW